MPQCGCLCCQIFLLFYPKRSVARLGDVWCQSGNRTHLLTFGHCSRVSLCCFVYQHRRPTLLRLSGLWSPVQSGCSLVTGSCREAFNLSWMGPTFLVQDINLLQFSEVISWFHDKDIILCFNGWSFNFGFSAVFCPFNIIWCLSWNDAFLHLNVSFPLRF